MARITVEDCIKYIPNRFELTIAASVRARQISPGSGESMNKDIDKCTVSALREIASGKSGIELIKPK